MLEPTQLPTEEVHRGQAMLSPGLLTFIGYNLSVLGLIV